MDYWLECIKEAFEDTGIIATEEQIRNVAGWVEGAHENYGMAYGHDCIPNPMISEIEKLKMKHKEEIKDFEKMIFAKKGLDTVSDGMSQTIQINEASSVRNTQDDLSSKLSSLFTLDKQNKDADSDDLVQLRKTYNK